MWPSFSKASFLLEVEVWGALRGLETFAVAFVIEWRDDVGLSSKVVRGGMILCAKRNSAGSA